MKNTVKRQLMKITDIQVIREKQADYKMRLTVLTWDLNHYRRKLQEEPHNKQVKRKLKKIYQEYHYYKTMLSLIG